MSVGRQPSCHVSVVSIRTSKPDLHARLSSDNVMSSSWLMYNWKNRGLLALPPFGPTRRMSLIATFTSTTCKHTVIVVHAVALVMLRGSQVVCSGNRLDRLRGCSRETVGKTEFTCDSSRHQLAVWRIQLIDTNGCEAYGSGDFVSK